MNYTFFVIHRSTGTFIFGSNNLSECLDLAQRHPKVEIVDVFGQVWGGH